MTIIIFWSVRLAPEEISNDLTGFGHNGVTCIGMKTDIPVIILVPSVSVDSVLQHVLMTCKLLKITVVTSQLSFSLKIYHKFINDLIFREYML